MTSSKHEDEQDPPIRQAPMPDNKHAGPVPNLKCPLCQGLVMKTPTEDQGTIYVAEATSGFSEVYYDDATRMTCVNPECTVCSFYMGCKQGLESVGAKSPDFRGGHKKRSKYS